MKTIKAYIFLGFFFPFVAQAQNCSLTIKGSITEAGTKKSLPSASITLDSIKIVSEKDGSFQIQNVCTGNHNVHIFYEDHDSLQQVINVTSDTLIVFQLTSKIKSLEAVTVNAVIQKKEDIVTLTSSDIKGTALLQTRGNTLGESLKNVTGINSLQTGPSISKPVIHGLQGNRLLILNNGVRQEGQQWGSEHAPEIDPFIASRITIIKGAAGVRYGSDAITGVILLEPPLLDPKKSFEGEADLVAATNGRMGVASVMTEGKFDKSLSGFSWRVQGTLKRAGNFRTAHYYLKNSGLYEGDFSAATSYKKENYGIELYFSQFHNKVGIFEGSHVGNVTDLYAAFSRKTPITPSYFSYAIGRTYQNINHDLFKTDAFYKFRNGNKIDAIFTAQKNRRDEYDIDLPYSSDPEVLKKPQISFTITTQTLELVYEQQKRNHFSGSFGISGSTQGNVFRGIRYLVPNFRNYSGGAFAIERFTKDKLTLEAGARYDHKWLRVYKLNNVTLQTYHNTSTYSNVTGTVGASYKFNSRFSITTNIGSAWRAPSINELYIDGIHLSAASYEKGDSTLQSERSYDFTVSAKYETEKFSGEVVVYDNIINNFIYAKPSLQPIQLISGTYPYFQYTQADVNLTGIDIDLAYSPFKRIDLISKTSLLRAWNRTIHDYLIFMPADRFDNSIKYTIPSMGNLKNAYISLQNILVLKQTRVPPNSDYVAPPPGYSLLNLSLGCVTHPAKKEWSINLGFDNITNVSYRDYLNRFRYYCDDLGINVVLRTKLVF